MHTLFIFVFLFCSACLTAQQLSGSSQVLGQVNAVTPELLFLRISPDAAASGMGESGTASLHAENATYWNPSKLAFVKSPALLSFSYIPWLRALYPDSYFCTASGHYRIGEKQVVCGSIRYFSREFMGQLSEQRIDKELAMDAGYVRLVTKHIAASTQLRYIHSGITGSPVSGLVFHDVSGFAADLSTTWRNDSVKAGNRNIPMAVGIHISNIGPKVSYSDSLVPGFMPVNLCAGYSAGFFSGKKGSWIFNFDLKKLLVPTPPIYVLDASTGAPVVNPSNGSYLIAAGKDPNRSVLSGIVGSFSDAPGGLKEELREINIATGMEYWHNKRIAVRAGYFYEHPLKGNRQFFTLGAGLRYNVFGFDFAYLVPTNRQRSPLENTLRFTLTFDFDAFKAQNKDTSK